MKKHFILRPLNITLLVWTLLMALGLAQRMPQDSWYLKKTVETGMFIGGAASDADGNVYLSDAKLGLIKKFSPTYQLLQTWGGLGTGDGQFGTIPFQDAVRFPDWSPVGAGGLCFTADQELVVCDPANHRVQVFSRTGQFLRKFGSQGANDGQFNRPAAAVSADGKIYVADRDNHRIQVFSSSGAFVSKFGTPGAFDGQFAKPSGLAFLPDGKVAVADSGNRRIQVFSAAGVYVRKLSQSAYSLSASRDGILFPSEPWCTLALASDESWNKKLFEVDSLISAWGQNSSGQTTVPSGLSGVVAIAAGREHTAAVKIDGTVTAWGGGGSGQTTVPSGLSGVVAIAAGQYHTVALKSDGTVTAWGQNSNGQTTVPSGLSGVVAIAAGQYHTVALKGSAAFTGNCVLPSGDVIATRESGSLLHYARTFRTILPESPNSIPLPVVISSSQRPGTGLVDIDFRVDDADDATVQVAALAFKNGGTSLADVIPIKTLVEGTANKLGANVATGQVHRITWDARADVTGDFEQVKVEILAKDARGLFNLDFIQIPVEGAQPTLKISKTPLKDADFDSAMLWLVASGDPELAFANGKVTKVSDGSLLATSYRWVAWDITQSADADFAMASEFELYQGATKVPMTGVTVTGSGSPNNLKDGSLNTEWNSHEGKRLVFQFPITVDFDSYRFATGGIQQWRPVSWSIQLSEDGVNWTTVDTKTNATVPSTSRTWTDIFKITGNSSAAERAFLLARMGLREATAEEVLRAQEAGTPGVINQWTPPLQVGPGERPVKVNAYGFETGDTGTWVVPVTP